METFTDDSLEDFVDQITDKAFVQFCAMDGCNETILDAVRNKVKESVLKHHEAGKLRVEITMLIKPMLTALFHNEKLLYEAAFKELDEDNDETEEEEWVEKTEITMQEDFKEKNQGNDYFHRLCEYKKEEDLVSRVRGVEMRGRQYKVSKDGSCPTCHFKSNIFVILDFLFLAGDMPEILNYLIGEGKAVMWSSKENIKFKDPPTFLCNGRCPISDAMRCGFNINWETTDLDKIFLFPEQNYKESTKPKKSKVLLTGKMPGLKPAISIPSLAKVGRPLERSSALVEEYEDEVYDEALVDIEHYRGMVSWFVIDEFTTERSAIPVEEKSMIRTMLALEQARADFVVGNMKTLTQSLNMDVSSCDSDSEDLQLRHTNEISRKSSTISPLTSPSVSESIVTIASENPSSKADLQDEPFVPYKQANFNDATSWSISHKSNNKPIIVELKQDESQEVADDAMDIEIYDFDEEGNMKEITVDENKIGEDDEITFAGVITTTATTSSDTTSPVATSVSAISPTLKDVFADATKAVNSVVISSEITSQTVNKTTAGTYLDQHGSTEKANFTADDFPVSKDGACPYCKSQDVIYIILRESTSSTEKMPELLEKLQKLGKAEIRVKGDYELPSFQCRSCTYGFNLDWASTDLEKIFLKPKSSTASITTTNAYPATTNVYSAHAYNAYYGQQQAGYPYAMTSMPYYSNPWMPWMPTVGASAYMQWNQMNSWGAYPPPPPGTTQQDPTAYYQQQITYAYTTKQQMTAYEQQTVATTSYQQSETSATTTQSMDDTTVSLAAITPTNSTSTVSFVDNSAIGEVTTLTVTTSNTTISSTSTSTSTAGANADPISSKYSTVPKQSDSESCVIDPTEEIQDGVGTKTRQSSESDLGNSMTDPTQDKQRIGLNQENAADPIKAIDKEKITHDIAITINSADPTNMTDSEIEDGTEKSNVVISDSCDSTINQDIKETNMSSCTETKTKTTSVTIETTVGQNTGQINVVNIETPVTGDQKNEIITTASYSISSSLSRPVNTLSGDHDMKTDNLNIQEKIVSTDTKTIISEKTESLFANQWGTINNDNAIYKKNTENCSYLQEKKAEYQEQMVSLESKEDELNNKEKEFKIDVPSQTTRRSNRRKTTPLNTPTTEPTQRMNGRKRPEPEENSGNIQSPLKTRRTGIIVNAEELELKSEDFDVPNNPSFEHLLSAVHSPTDRIFSLPVDETNNKFTDPTVEESTVDETSPFTDSLVNIMADTTTTSSSEEKMAEHSPSPERIGKQDLEVKSMLNTTIETENAPTEKTSDTKKTTRGRGRGRGKTRGGRKKNSNVC